MAMSKYDDSVPKDISITKIKYTDTKQADGNIKKLVKTFLVDYLKIEDTFESPKEVDTNGKTFFTITRTIKKESKQAGENDQNHGELCFVYWADAKSVNIYCLGNTGRSGAWTSLRPIRDSSFPRKFAKTFLNSRMIRAVEVNYLTNTNDSSPVSLSFEEGKFESYDIMDKYGIVKTFSAPIDNRTQQGKELLEKLGKSPQKENPITVQIGQIKLPLFVTKDRKISPDLHIDMLLMIHENIYVNKSTNSCTDQDWKFYDYIQPTFDKEKIDILEKKLNDRVFEYLSNKQSNQELPVNSKLTYVHQDCFDYASRINLLFGDNKINWFSKGRYLTINDIFDGIKVNIKKLTDLDKLKLQFYDWVENRLVSKPFLEMIDCQLTVSLGDEMLPAYKFNGKWHLVKLDSCFNITMNFVDVVKKCLKITTDGQFPEVLPWSHKEGAKNKTASVFSMDVLYDFCVQVNIKPEERANGIKKLKAILVTETQMLKKQKKNEMLPKGVDGKTTSIYKNNFLGNNVYLTSLTNPPSQSNHSLDLLSLNTCIFKKKNDPCPKDLQEKLTNKDSFEIQLPAGENKAIDFCKNLNENSQTLEKIKGNFFVKTPYLSIDIWKDIKNASINICPVRLVQFLRMYSTHLEEGDYNELYHLSNCKCRQYNHDFIYVVGDRIFDNENHKIELFDVMAINSNRTICYLLHVKSGFGGDSSRDMCSQVRVCGQLLWQSLSTHTPDNRNMLQKFHAVATKPSRLVHEKLTKNEIEMIGKSEEDFLKVMMCGDVKYHVCAAPCLLEHRFLSVLKTNLKYVFNERDFSNSKNKKVFSDLKDTGVINRIKNTINPIIFDKVQFLKNVQQLPQPTKAEEVYKTIFKKIAGGESDPLITSRFSLIAKIMLIDLYKKFNNFGESVQFGILVVPYLKSKVPAATKHDDPNQNNTKQTTMINHFIALPKQ